MANKNKIPCCPKCGLPLERETEEGIDYPYVCRFCDENFYELEAVYRPKSEVPKLSKYERDLYITLDEMADIIVGLNGDGPFMSADYIGGVARKIVKAVMRDVWETADRDNWNDDDVRLAVGRVLCEKLHCENN